MQNLRISELSTLTGLSIRRVHQLREDNIITPLARGEYAPDAIKAILAHYRAHSVSEEQKAQRVRLLKSEADMAELRVKERRGELIQECQFNARCSDVYFAVAKFIDSSGLSYAEKAKAKELLITTIGDVEFPKDRELSSTS